MENKLVACQQLLDQSKQRVQSLVIERDELLHRPPSADDSKLQEMHELVEALNEKNQQCEAKLQAMERSAAEANQLRDELQKAQQKLKLRSGQCLLSEGIKQKSNLSYEAQLVEMQKTLQSLKDSELALKYKIRQKDGRLYLLQAQVSKLKQGATCEAILAGDAEEDAVQQCPHEQQEQEQIAGEEIEETPMLYIAVDATTQADVSRRVESVQDGCLVERLQNEKDGLHSLIQSMKADREMRERIVETMRDELQSIIAAPGPHRGSRHAGHPRKIGETHRLCRRVVRGVAGTPRSAAGLAAGPAASGEPHHRGPSGVPGRDSRTVGAGRHPRFPRTAGNPDWIVAAEYVLRRSPPRDMGHPGTAGRPWFRQPARHAGKLNVGSGCSPWRLAPVMCRNSGVFPRIPARAHPAVSY